jgi:hypothetical protein
MRVRPALVFVVFVGGILVGVGGAVALVGRVKPTAPVVVEQLPSETAPARRAHVAAADPAIPDLRPAIRARVAAVLAENRRGHELDIYLEELEHAARAQGHVSALEVAPGMAAIEAAYPGDVERTAAFARRMEDLQRQLGQTTLGPDDPPAGVTAASLLQAIASAPSSEARDKLLRQTITAIGRLPEAEQAEASKALERATTPSPAPPPAEPATLLAQIAAAQDPAARRDLVLQFSAATSALPPEQQEPLYRQLDQATAAR